MIIIPPDTKIIYYNFNQNKCMSMSKYMNNNLLDTQIKLQSIDIKINISFKNTLISFQKDILFFCI